ncbi:MAG: VWA domain-containing protein [Deltaproteobacteria bacterium]|nr:VWA domain-containing protein [Deltaproteobacteria bacterium]
MFRFFASARKGLCIGAALLLVLCHAPVRADLSELEGTHGHAPVDGPSALEGTVEAGGPSIPGVVDDGVTCEPGSPCRETATELPLRVLPRPFSNMYHDAEAKDDAVARANVPAFRPLYVFERQGLDLNDPADPKGWYRVGSSRIQPEGWMQAKDVLEWRQALLVSYTHPGNPLEGRRPVLMFRDKAALEGVVDDLDMAGRAGELYKSIEAGNVPESVVSMEPQRFVDITRQFYVLPILQWSQTQIGGDDVRLLQLAAAVPRSRGADTLENDEYRDQAQVGRTQGGAVLADVKADIVFVVDTTRSMQPFIDLTREAVAGMAKKFSGDTADRFRFGLVVYRDSLEVAPRLEYVTKNLTPELVGAEDLAGLLASQAGATSVGSVDYAEEAFAGVDVALRSKWRDGALRFVILLGDASAHPKGHKQNTTGKDEVDLRREYDDAQVHLLAVHLQDPRAEEDYPAAQGQFSHLARVRGEEGEAAIKEIKAFDEEEYRAFAEHLTARVTGLMSQTRGKEPAQGAAAEPLAEIDKLWEAALIEYIGKEASPPKDIVAWAVDRDLTNPADRSLEVRVLVTREQLSSLAQALDQVVQALMRAEVTQSQFFEALQAVSGQTMKRPEDIAGATKLADAGLLPAFIQSLPYKSDILSLTDDMFASMTAEQRSRLEWSILAKLDQYRAINEQVDAWFRLNDTDSDQDLVYPLHIDYLP